MRGAPSCCICVGHHGIVVVIVCCSYPLVINRLGGSLSTLNIWFFPQWSQLGNKANCHFSLWWRKSDLTEQGKQTHNTVCLTAKPEHKREILQNPNIYGEIYWLRCWFLIRLNMFLNILKFLKFHLFPHFLDSFFPQWSQLGFCHLNCHFLTLVKEIWPDLYLLDTVGTVCHLKILIRSVCHYNFLASKSTFQLILHNWKCYHYCYCQSLFYALTRSFCLSIHIFSTLTACSDSLTLSRKVFVIYFSTRSFASLHFSFIFVLSRIFQTSSTDSLAAFMTPWGEFRQSSGRCVFRGSELGCDKQQLCFNGEGAAINFSHRAM